MRSLTRILGPVLLLLLTALEVASAPPTQAAGGGPATPVAAGYWLTAADGGVFGYGAPFHGSMGGRRLNSGVVGMASTPTGRGYWQVAADGGVFSFGDARFLGSMGGRPLNRPIVGMASTPSGHGYWLVASDGGIFAFGDAVFAGSTGGQRLNQPIVGMAATPTGYGYWLVASDGGIFAFGDAVFRGSTGGMKLFRPIVGMASSGTGRGYWLVASDGGVFSYGDAPFMGSMGGMALNAPIVAMAGSPRGMGYWLVAADGGIFAFGEAPFSGSAGNLRLAAPVLAIAAPPLHLGAEVAAFYYPWYGTPARDGAWRHWNGHGHEAAPVDIPADFYPTRGTYSSSDPVVLDAHMAEMAAAGVTTVVSSWWGRGSFEDQVLPAVLAAARNRGLRLAVHIEPYGGRYPGSVGIDLAHLQHHGIGEAWIYDGMAPNVADWAAVTRHYPGMRLFIETSRLGDMVDGDFARYARAGGFDGIYTYDPVRYNRAQFAAACGAARHQRLLCSPSVSPGHSTLRTFPNRMPVRRDHGVRYDHHWMDAVAVGGDTVSITSYNEWHEGTQLEPSIPYCFPDGFCTSGFEGAYGRTGPAAQHAYLDRTRDWAQYLRAFRGH